MEPIEVYFDYMSPFAYLAAEVLPGFADRIGVPLCWKPIDLLKLDNYASGLPYSPLTINANTSQPTRCDPLSFTAYSFALPSRSQFDRPRLFASLWSG